MHSCTLSQVKEFSFSDLFKDKLIPSCNLPNGNVLHSCTLSKDKELSSSNFFKDMYCLSVIYYVNNNRYKFL